MPAVTYASAFTPFFPAIAFSTSAIARLVFRRESGVTLMESMPNSTRNCAESGTQEVSEAHLVRFFFSRASSSLPAQVSSRSGFFSCSTRSLISIAGSW